MIYCKNKDIVIKNQDDIIKYLTKETLIYYIKLYKHNIKLFEHLSIYLDYELVEKPIKRESLEKFEFIDLKGFILFRTDFIRKYINDILNCYNNFLNIDNKYKNTLNDIKTYLKTKKHFYDSLEIEFRCNNSCLMKFSKNEGFVGANRNFLINETYIKEFLLDLILDKNPKEIIIYNINYVDNRNIIKTLYNIYESRLKVINTPEI